MSTPRVSIGLVVRNGEKHLAEAIQSLLDQTYRDFELNVYDNASTDRTNEIAMRFAQRDERVRLVRHHENLGALGNYIHAAGHADGELFCWAAHDDRREPTFLATLVTMLDDQPKASLACCAVRDMNLDGTACEVRPETASLRSTSGMSSLDRLRNYFREAPATPIYGLFRNHALKQHLDVLKNARRFDGSLTFGADVAFLASFWRDHEVVVANKPLLLFRRGGVSHQLESLERLRPLTGQISAFRRLITTAIRRPDDSVLMRLRLSRLRDGYFRRLLISPPLRRIIGHAILRSWPFLKPWHAGWICRTNRPFRRLRHRCASLPPGSTIAIFGAGKHTRRWLHVLRHAAGKRVSLAMIVDDAAIDGQCIDGVPVVCTSRLLAANPDVVIVSSDSYEAALFRRAQQSTAADTEVWSIYDRTLETVDARSSASIERRTPSIQSMASSVA